MAILTGIEAIQLLIICEIREVILILGTAIRTLQTLKEPFCITARA